MSSPLRPARVGAFGAAAILTVILAGCATAAPTPAPSASPQSDPVFATEEEALAAAEEAYAEYLAVSDEVAQDGWADTNALHDVARSEALQQDLEDAAMLSGEGNAQIGQTTFSRLRLQDWGSEKALTAYVCLDVSAVDIVNEDGDSTVPTERLDLYPLEIELAHVDGSTDDLLLTRSDLWSGENFC
ncbi:hypothetical protein [Marisediminicola sp. LYQ85]|uniref:hypothetical protein n=1 Tax=Marisediminicola sp. LYQ85 TaxID=3391062 RepID=UPI003983B40C